MLALFVEPWAEADGSFSVGFGRDVGPSAPVTDHRAQPVGIIGFVSEHHLSLADVGEQFRCCLDVMRLAGGDDDLDRQAIVVGQSMDFRSKTAPASSKTSIRVAFFKVAAA